MKIRTLVFLIACLLLCLIPSVGLLLFPTTQTSENRAMTQAPELIQEGQVNTRFFDDFGDYFNEHMGLRNAAVTADARIQETLFGVSNVDGVIVGEDGWLYYTATLPDYLGTDVMSERELFSLANNLAIVRDCLAEREIELLVTVPPNKNTLYGEHMPYYDSCTVEPDHNAVLLKAYLTEQEVPYLDLFELFEGQDEVLYWQRDSHWNARGACLVYNAVLDELGVEHERYDTEEPVITKSHSGDLDRMLHSFFGEPEEDYAYPMKQTYWFTDETADVADGWVVSENPEGAGSILMFRDSFADNLIPFFSDAFAKASYSKSIPAHLERLMERDEPDCVVIEVVERNLVDYLTDPPILSALPGELPNDILIAETDSTVSAAVSEYDVNYCHISGTVDPARLRDDADILVSVNGTVCRAYLTGENSFALYLKTADLDTAQPLKIRVFAVAEGNCVRVLAEDLTLAG